MRPKVLLFVAVAVLGVAAGAMAAVLSREMLSGYDPPITIPGEKVLPDFTLTDQNGRPFSLSSVRGKAVLLYFGYTNCPDVCPLVLSKFGKTLKDLGDKADRFAVIFITVDPERDTVEAMRRYVSYYSPKIIALTGTPEEIEKVMALYNVYAKKHPPDEKGNYIVDHYALVLGADKNHVLRAALTPDTDVEDYRKTVEWLLSK
ncbi:MAG: SCO family protein [Candidatus Caldarchaeum sp.]|nr:SCO family protein [Candidatus Caldarchaeum sp.]